MAQFNIPRVENETYQSQNTKMTITISIIFILILLGVYLQKSPSMPHLHHTTAQLDSISAISNDISKPSNNLPVPAKYITLTNINRKNIPVTKIVVMSVDRQLHPIYIKNSTKFNKCGGIVLEFELPKEMPIVQLIIDVDVLCESHLNIRTTQIELHDMSHKLVWSYGKLMPVGNRYITVYVVEPNIIYDNKPQQVLCNGSTVGCHGLSTPAYRSQDCNQELLLSENIATNSWL